MKNVFIYAILGLILIVGSCKKLVDEQPKSDGTLDQFFKTIYDANAAMAGMYGAFQQTMVGEAQFNNRYTYWGEGRSDNMERQQQYSNNSTTELHLNTLSANNSYSDWSPLYTVIGRANLNILKFPDINKYAAAGSKDVIDQPTLLRYLSECYAMRAVCYFYIVRLWGDAPIRTAPYLDISQEPAQPRDPKDSVMAQVIRDATTAYNLVAKGANANVWYVNEAAICALLADAYMWTKDYNNAIKWEQNLFKAKSPTGKLYNPSASALIGSGGAATDLETTTSWKTPFVTPAASIESIWNIHWDVTANGCPCMAGISPSVNNTPFVVSTELWSGVWSKDTADIRPKSSFDVTKSNHDRVWKWFPGSFGPTGPKGSYTLANPNFYTDGSSTTTTVYLPMYRLADQFLLYAEALNKIGDRTDALKYLNLIHTRAGLKPYVASQFPDDPSMENAILQERQWELFGEGKRWFDLVRTDHVIQVMDPILRNRQKVANADTVGFGGDKRKYLWPINRNILNANPKITQNPPYSG